MSPPCSTTSWRSARSTTPVDAENSVARLEELIRRQLHARGPLSRRDLSRWTHANRYGAWMFENALQNLVRARDVRFDRASRRYALGEDVADA